MVTKIERNKPIDEDTKLIMETLANIVPKDHPNYDKITSRAQAPVKTEKDKK